MTKKGEAELNQPDQFHTIFNKFADFYILNRKKVILTASVILGVLAIISAWTSYRHFNEKNAWEEYVKIEEFMLKSTSSEQSDELIKKYKNLSQNYPDSQAANLSSYRMGNLYFNKNDLDAAISSYEKFLSRASDRNELKVLSYSGLAYCYEAKKDFNKALQALQQAEKIEAAKSLETFIYRDMGRICEKMGNPGEALKYYKKALAQSMDPTFTMFIKRKIALLS